MSGNKSKQKGAHNERQLAAWLRHTGIDHKAERNVGSGAGRVKSDIISPNTNLNIETKAYKSLGLTSRAMKQSMRDADMSGQLPILFLREDGMPEDTWMVVMYSDMWLDLWKRAREPKKVNDDNREATYLVKGAIQALKRLLKYLERNE